MSADLQYIKPVTIGASNFVSSTRAENDHAAWSGATTYAKGDRAINTTTHRIYESVQAGNLNHDPTTDTTATWWIDVGPTNRWAMFDQAVGSVTSQATPLTVEVDPGLIGGVALLDLAGTSVRVQLTDGATSVYDKTYSISDDAILVDWYDYFFATITPATTLIVTDLPPYSTARLKVTINAATTAQCGTLACGEVITVGSVRAGASLGIIDYSKKEVDQWGVTAITQRAYAKRFDLDVLVQSGRVDYIAQQFAAVRATPCIWIGSTQYESLIAYGWLREWGINITYPTLSELKLQIEGLT